MSNLNRKISLVKNMIVSRPKGWQSLLYNSSMAQLKIASPLMSPVHISIEPTNACNARCPVCETGKGDMRRRAGFLDKKLYTEFINKISDTTSTLLFYFMGEPFMHKDSYDMIRFARDKGIYVESCTNGDFVDPEGIIYSDINKLSFQIGGMDQETHEIYRIRSKLNKTIENIEQLIKLRKKHNNSSLQIEVGFIVMRHNEHQVKEFYEWAKRIGVDIANVIDPCARNMMEAYAYLPNDRKYWFYDEEAFNKGYLKPKKVSANECVWIWNSLQLTWNGDAVPCCRDTNGSHVFGNVFESRLNNVFNSEKAIAFRKKILSDQGKIDICKLCSGYGLPVLNRTKSAEFIMKRDTLNLGKIPDHDKSILEASNRR
jgi:radical SAM protein with 4Fe4S-binding SPASM domain